MSICCVATMLALVLCLLLASATAARLDDQQLSMGEASGAQPRKDTLMTYYIDIFKPTIELSSRGSGRTDRTGLTVRMSEASVSGYVPVVSPRPSGMTHDVVKTWDALKNLAVMFTHVRVINQQNPSGLHMFPRGAIAVQAASDAGSTKTDIASLIAAAEARGHRSMWAETSPGSVLLLPHGSPTAAVADIMDVTYDHQTGLLSLELDLVHQPHTVSEFEPHAKQTLDTDSAHYHFTPAPGVTIDAQVLIERLQESRYVIPGVHMFLKQAGGNFCRHITNIVADNTNPQPGDRVNVTVTVVREECPPTRTPPTPPPLQTHAATTDIKALPSNCVIVAMLVSGPTTVEEFLVDCPSSTRAQPSASIAQQVTSGGFAVFTEKLDQGETWVVFTVIGTGPVVVRASVARSDQSTVFDPTGQLTIKTLILNADSEGQPPVTPVEPITVAELLLSPAKAYRRCHDPITVVALALNASGRGVAGAKLAFSVQGDDKSSQQVVKTTDATGRASFTIYGDKPEAITVVAAAVGADGAPVLSQPSNLFFFEERQHVDHSERNYYEGSGRGRDVDSYAATASLRAMKAVMKPVSQSN